MVKRILTTFGTRPEAIKLAPLINRLSKDYEMTVCVSAQHREMLDQVLALFEIQPDFDLNIMKPGQSLTGVTSGVLEGMTNIIEEVDPELTIVHGDTTTTMAASLASFYARVPVAHVEAGLRTYDRAAPFPEEINRQLVGRIADYHFAPTETAKRNLLEEKISKEDIYITGNTIIDALLDVANKASKFSYPTFLLKKLPFLSDVGAKKIILVTGHRRENFGPGFKEICQGIAEISKLSDNIEVVYPVHLNPNVKNVVEASLSDIHNVHLIAPLDYLNFVKLMTDSFIILTDSGGIQEEAPSLGKPVLVMRETTERPEAVQAGTVRIVGANKHKILNEVERLFFDRASYEAMGKAHNPYGDGTASEQIAQIISRI